MKILALHMAFAMSIALALPAGVSAKEYNKRKHLGPGAHAKVTSVIAGARRNKTITGAGPTRIMKMECEESQTKDFKSLQRRGHEVVVMSQESVGIRSGC